MASSNSGSGASVSPWGGSPAQASARFVICIPYIVSALQKFQTFHKATGGPLSAVLASKIGILLQHVNQLTGHDIHVPKDLYPRLFLTTAVAEFMGALLFISDQRFGCWVLFWYTIVNTVLMHNFWDAKDPSAMQAELTAAIKNVSIMGGLLFYLATSKGTRHQRQSRQSREAGAPRTTHVTGGAAATLPGDQINKKDR